MEGFDKIKDINLSELDEDHTLESELGSDHSVTPSEEIGEEGPVARKIEDGEAYERPEGRYYTIDADITEAEIRNFMLGHAYREPLIILINVIAVVFAAYYVFKGTGTTSLSLAITIIVLIYYPFTTILKAKSIKKTNTAFRETFHYIFDEKACHLQLSQEAIDVEWRYFTKMMILKSVVVVYTGKNNGYIVPTKDMKEKREEIIAFLKEKIRAGK